jgi:hypothetical protein
MAYESSKSSPKNQATKVGVSTKSSAKLAASSGDSKSGMPTKSGSEVAFQECDAIESDLAALKVVYEHYFMGIERTPPTRTYEDLKRRLERLKNSFVRNTAAKFRVQAIHSKFVTYERLWLRTMQEIENGTYKRDVVKARRRVEKTKPTSGKPRTSEVEPLDEALDVQEVTAAPVPFRGEVPAMAPLVPSIPAVAPMVPSVAPAVAPVRPASRPGIPAVAPVVPPMAPAVAPLVPPVAPRMAPVVPPVARAVPPGAARPPTPPGARPPAAPSPSELSDAKLKTVYDAYVAAKRHNKEDTSKMSYDSIAASLRKQVPELMKQHNAKSVEFKVVIKDGKAVLKAVPK